MANFTNPLSHVKIAAPCQANWNEMHAFEGERVRYCSQCQRNVYNLSALKREEAETLILKTEGRLCVRFYRRADGTILTQKCSVGLAALKQRVSWGVQFGVGMMLGFLGNLGLLSLLPELTPRPSPVMGAMVFTADQTEPLKLPIAAEEEIVDQLASPKELPPKSRTQNRRNLPLASPIQAK